MKNIKLVILFCVVLFLIGCSDNEKTSEVEKYVNDCTVAIESIKEENEILKDELENINSNYSVYLQQLDSTSRTIVRMIEAEQYETIKSNYNVDFKLENDEIIFESVPDNSGFPTDKASLPMSIAYFNVQNNGSEVGYYIDDLETGDRLLATFKYDKNLNFNHIYIGDV